MASKEWVLFVRKLRNVGEDDHPERLLKLLLEKVADFAYCARRARAAVAEHRGFSDEASLILVEPLHVDTMEQQLEFLQGNDFTSVGLELLDIYDVQRLHEAI